MPKHSEDENKKVSNSKNKATKKNKNNVKAQGKLKTNKKIKFKDKHPKLSIFIKIMIILILLLCVIGAGIVVGMFFGLFGDEFEITKDELMIAASNSVVVDKQGNVIADLSGDERRKVVKLSEMSDYLPKAYVAIEDERFYSHKGVDFKRTAAAGLSFIAKGNSSFGGSTITQQLVKNITQDKEKDVFRKVKEWAKAYQVERMISKDQILELYLNILFIGGNNYGVQLGSQYYFAKDAKDLDLAECAFLAGINNSPNAYNPYGTANPTEKIKTRTKAVLSKMKELGYIKSNDDYNQAVAKVDAGFEFKQGTLNGNIYSYHTDATIKQVIDQVAEEKGISAQLAENYVYSSGLTIYSTQDTNLQNLMQEEFKQGKYILKSRKNKNEDGTPKTTQAAMVVIDNSTNEVVGCVGGLGDKTESRGLNRATQSTRQTGSAMKPLSDIVPGLQEGIITPATMYNDSATEFDNGKYKPKNYNGFKGVINVRQFIETSQNIPAVKIMAELTPKKSIEYLKKMGITTLDDKNDQVLSLAIGGITNGISPLEMAGAYASIANNGVYTKPTFFTKVVDASGNVVLTSNQPSERVCSEEIAYLTKSILQEPVTGGSGTARYCAIPGISVAAKTGTTNSDYDRWLCGFTPYYTAATWFGYDDQETVIYGGTNPAGQLWDNIMTPINKDMPKASFQQPGGIVTATVCRTTGQLASGKCGSTYQEIFAKGALPSPCEGHSSYEICKESGELANEFCPDKETKYKANLLPKEQLNLWKTIGNGTGKIPTNVCQIHKSPEEDKKEDEEKAENEKNNTSRNNTNTNKTNSTNKTNTTNTTNTNKVQNTTNTTKPNDENKVTNTTTPDKKENTTKEEDE